jgi:hypothetical protein
MGAALGHRLIGDGIQGRNGRETALYGRWCESWAERSGRGLDYVSFRGESMTYDRFKELTLGTEKPHVDFKLECHAFASKQVAPKAELAKDICAMANNGNVASYILVGVSDDRRTFKAVKNQHLTDENLQTFVKTAIFPPPKVKLTRHKWPSARGKLRGKEFVVIQVGPQARKAFRFARDFVEHTERVSYRRNEVWVRRGSTSDLATPEEIGHLVRGKPIPIQEDAIVDQPYDRLTKEKRLAALTEDLSQWIAEMDAEDHGGAMVLKLRRTRYVLAVLILDECTRKFSVWESIAGRWRYEHGLLLLLNGQASRRAFHDPVPVNFKESWGHFTQYSLPSYLLPEHNISFPLNASDSSLFSLVLPRINSTRSLRSALTSMVEFLNTDDQTYGLISDGRRSMNKNLRRWLKDGWHSETGRIHVGGRPKETEIGENEFFSTRHRQVLHRYSYEDEVEAAQRVLTLSNR